MKGRLFIARSHEEGHNIIRREKLAYDPQKDKLLSTTGSDARAQLLPLVPDPQKIYLLGDWVSGLHADRWREQLEITLARTRHSLDDCKRAG